MKQLIITALFLCVIANHTHPETTSSVSDGLEKINTIDLTAGFDNIQTVRLSEIADSVTFLPFETTKQSLMGAGQKHMIFSIPYIFFYNNYFDWNGKFLGTIIKRGQGPYEEVDGGKLLFKDNHFYSKGSKFIEYDKTGKPTGKVRNLYSSREFGTNDFLRWGTAFTSLGKYFMVYDYPHTIYYIDKDFETASSRNVFQTKPTHIYQAYNADNKFVTHYKDKILFYNFINDTIFYVTDAGLEPQWVVQFDHPSRLPLPVMLESANLHVELRKVAPNLLRLSDSDLVKKIDGKYIILAAYETESHIFFPMKQCLPYAEPRGLTPSDPPILYFDKKTEKAVRVKGKGFVDDLLGMDFFFPQLGIFEQKMISFIWPYELFDYIEDCKKKGRDVNPKLLALSKKVDAEDNPILILVHLKK